MPTAGLLTERTLAGGAERGAQTARGVPPETLLPQSPCGERAGARLARKTRARARKDPGPSSNGLAVARSLFGETERTGCRFSSLRSKIDSAPAQDSALFRRAVGRVASTRAGHSLLLETAPRVQGRRDPVRIPRCILIGRLFRPRNRTRRGILD